MERAVQEATSKTPHGIKMKPEEAEIIEKINDLNLEDSVGDKTVLKAQNLLLQYFKSSHKQKMPDVIKTTLKTVDKYVRDASAGNLQFTWSLHLGDHS